MWSDETKGDAIGLKHNVWCTPKHGGGSIMLKVVFQNEKLVSILASQAT